MSGLSEIVVGPSRSSEGEGRRGVPWRGVPKGKLAHGKILHLSCLLEFGIWELHAK